MTLSFSRPFLLELCGLFMFSLGGGGRHSFLCILALYTCVIHVQNSCLDLTSCDFTAECAILMIYPVHPM
jgi:hypothetical protein